MVLSGDVLVLVMALNNDGLVEVAVAVILE